MNLIESVGEDYFNSMFQHALMIHEGKVYKVRGVDGSRVVVSRVDGESAGASAYLPYNAFSGFKVFAYPELGYRRQNEHTVVYLTRIQSTNRGLRDSNIASTLSPFSRIIHDNRLAAPTISLSKSEMAMQPKFDRPERLALLRAGKAANVVLSDSVLIEPSLNSDNDWYDVFFHQTVVGKMNSSGKFTFQSTKHEQVVLPLVT